MAYQHVENLLIRFRGQSAIVKTISGAVYEGVIADITNDYVALKVEEKDGEKEHVIVLLHSIESILPRSGK